MYYFISRQTNKGLPASLRMTMKNILYAILLVLFSLQFALAQGEGVQQKPLTQTEYVRMLYVLEKESGVQR